MSRLEDIMKEQQETLIDWNGDRIQAYAKDKDTINAIKQYATECVKASLEKASENATVKSLEMFGGNFLGSPKIVDKESIINPENIILL